MKKSWLLYLIILLSVCSCWAQQEERIEIPAPMKDGREVILKRTGYTVSYNPETKIPNWVAWHLTAEHADGEVKRFRGGYLEDTDAPKPRATREDYYGSEWSHGHMCPAGDNKWDRKAMRETFLLTNMCPQDRSLNSGLWNRIEMDCRKWAKKYGDVYIVCGPVLLNREQETIGENRVVVPEAFFKVILCLQGHRRLSAISSGTMRGRSGATSSSILSTRWSESLASTSSQPCPTASRIGWRRMQT